LLTGVRIIVSARGGLTGDIGFGSAENEDTRQQGGGVDERKKLKVVEVGVRF